MSKEDWAKVEGMKEAIIEGRVILDPWWADDIEQAVHSVTSIIPTDEELLELLYIIQERFDADIGINWNFIEVIVADYYAGRTDNERR